MDERNQYTERCLSLTRDSSAKFHEVSPSIVQTRAAGIGDFRLALGPYADADRALSLPSRGNLAREVWRYAKT